MKERIIHIAKLGGEDLETLVQIQREFANRRPKANFTSMTGVSATYLFENNSDFRTFKKIVDRRGISYSCHPTEDYERLTTSAGEDRVGSAIYRLLS